jgi:hypothetical protein
MLKKAATCKLADRRAAVNTALLFPVALSAGDRHAVGDQRQRRFCLVGDDTAARSV